MKSRFSNQFGLTNQVHSWLRVFVLPMALCAWPAAPAGSQVIAEREAKIEAAILRQLKTELADARIVLEPSYLPPEGERGYVARDTVLARHFAQELGVAVGRLNEILICPSGATSCRLENTDAVIALSRPEVVGDEATVIVARWYLRQGALRPVAYIRQRFVLRLEGSEWSIRSRFVMVQS